MFITPAYAQEASSSGAGGFDIMTFAPLVLIGVVFYFLLIRPQQQQQKKHKQVVAGLRRGDRVVTGGGILGTVSKVVSETEVMVEIAENVRVRVMRTAISEVLAKTEPRGTKSSAGSDDDDEPSPTEKPVGRFYGRGKTKNVAAPTAEPTAVEPAAGSDTKDS